MVGSLVGNSVAGKVDQKSSQENFFGIRGNLMVGEDSEDEDGVARVRYDH